MFDIPLTTLLASTLAKDNFPKAFLALRASTISSISNSGARVPICPSRGEWMGLFNIVEFRNLEFRPGHNHNLSLLPAKHTFLNPVERTISSDFLHLHLNKMFLRCCLIVLSSTTYLSSGFTFVPFVPIPALYHRSTKFFSAVSSDTPSSSDSFFEEEAIVKSVKKSQLQTLCRQMNLPQIGTKKELFLRLKGHVNQIQSQSSSQSQYPL